MLISAIAETALDRTFGSLKLSKNCDFNGRRAILDDCTPGWLAEEEGTKVLAAFGTVTLHYGELAFPGLSWHFVPRTCLKRSYSWESYRRVPGKF